MFLSKEDLMEKLCDIIRQNEKHELEECKQLGEKIKKLKKFDYLDNSDKEKLNDILGPVSYELRVGKEAFLSGKNERVNIEEQGYVVIEPGMFASLLTYEYIKIPKELIGFISLKFGLKSKGLVNVSGFHVDPGFKGNLVFTVFNLGPHPIVLRYKQKAFLLFLAKLTKCAEYKGSHQGQKEIPSDIIGWLTGERLNFVQLENKISSLETKVNILVGASLSRVIALLSVFIKYIIGK